MVQHINKNRSFSRKYILLSNFYLHIAMSKVDTITIGIVFAFAVFLVGGLVVVPALEIANADSDIQLLKSNKAKNPNHKGGNCNGCG